MVSPVMGLEVLRGEGDVRGMRCDGRDGPSADIGTVQILEPPQLLS